MVGQEHVTQTLGNAITQKRIAHAYLFVGPRGTGKTTIARIFAKCLNCTDGPKVEFSEDDPKCKEITEGRCLDVLEIDGASNRGIDEIRDLRDTVRYAPSGGRYKIYIIDEVHMLTKEAFNALLKTLEEPPEHVKFMFATTEPEKILPTILSRCQRFDLRRIPSSLIVKHLAYIATVEKVNIEPAALEAIARGADGGMRDAESTLDQLISFCGDKIEEADVLSMFGLTAQSRLFDLAGFVLTGEAERCLDELNQLARQGKDLGRLVTDLLGHFRNLLVFKVSKGDLRLLEVSEAEAASLKVQSADVTAENLTRVMEVIGECEMRLRDAASKKTLIEVALLKAIEARRMMSLDAVLQQLKSLKSGSPEVVISAPPLSTPPVSGKPEPAQVERVSYAPASAPAALAPMMRDADVPTPAPAAPATGAAVDLADLWSRLVEAVGRASPFTRSYLIEAHPVSLSKTLFTIGFDPQFEDHISLVDNSRNHTLIATKLSELGHPNCQVKFVKAVRPDSYQSVQAPAAASPIAPSTPSRVASKPPTTSAPPTPAPVKERTAQPAFNKEEFKNDPLIKKALEIFKGQIVEVRS